MTAPLPRLSVVMPSFNQAEFLEEAVLSVLADTGDEVELVVADGGSTDATPERLAALAARFPGRLRWRSAPDAGPAAALNEAVRRARAPLLGWLNSDDRYAPGAIARALAHLEAHPGHAMVYGEAHHVDVAGRFLERYPTQRPDTPLAAFRDGCFICQPSVFLRRDAWLAAGGLDEGLKAAFDFDLWLRLFRAHPGGIGFIDAVQAHSRLHEGGITLRFRERVAREGIAVIARHLGSAPEAWLLTHLHELLARHPFAEGAPPAERIAALAAELAPQLDPGAGERLAQAMAADRRVALAGPHWALDVWPDGWAPARLAVRVCQPAAGQGAPLSALTLDLVHAHPRGAPMRVAVFGPDGPLGTLRLGGNGPYRLELPLPDPRPGARCLFLLQTEGAFVPREVEPGSADGRALAFRVERVRPAVARVQSAIPGEAAPPAAAPDRT